MSQDVGIGVTISAQDEISDVLRKIERNTAREGDQMQRSLREVGEAADDAGVDLESLATITTGLASAVQLGRAAFEGIRTVFESTITPSLELRAENDAQRVAFESMLDTVGELQATIGDLLIPALLQAFEAVRPLVEVTQDYFEGNEALSRSIGENLVGALRVLVVAYESVRLGIQTLIFISNEWAATYADAVSFVLERAGQLADALGQDGIAAGIRKSVDAMRDFGDTARSVADEAIGEIGQITEEWEAVDAAIVDGAARGAEYYGQTIDRVTPAIRRAQERQTELNDSAREGGELFAALGGLMVEAYDAATAGLDTMIERQQQLAELQAEAELERQQALDEAMEASRERLAEFGEMGAEFGESWGAALASGEASTERFAGTVLKILVGMIKDHVMAMAVQAAANAAQAHMGIPFIGPAIAVTMAGVAFGIVEGLLSQLPAFATGGRVPGSGSAQDTVVARLMPNELVVNPQQEDLLSRVLHGALGMDGGGARSASGGTTVVNHYGMLVPATRADLDETVRTGLLRSQRRLGELRAGV